MTFNSPTRSLACTGNCCRGSRRSTVAVQMVSHTTVKFGDAHSGVCPCSKATLTLSPLSRFSSFVSLPCSRQRSEYCAGTDACTTAYSRRPAGHSVSQPLARGHIRFYSQQQRVRDAIMCCCLCATVASVLLRFCSAFFSAHAAVLCCADTCVMCALSV